MILHNRHYLNANRKALRNNSTSAEATLWIKLKGKQVGGLKFRRQHSVGNYILDFYCPTLKLGIELDGEYHIYFEEQDMKKEKYLNSKGITIRRYENVFVFEYPEQIIEDILDFSRKLDKRR